MLRWLWKIIVGRPSAPPCSRECQWGVFNRDEIRDGAYRHIATGYTLRCKTCGDLKEHRSGT